MKVRALKGFVALLYLCYCTAALGGYRTYLDPRSMAMGGTGVASSTKFNASFHNPALIAFSRGDKPDKIYISASLGARETYNDEIENKINSFNNSSLKKDFRDAIAADDVNAIISTGNTLRNKLSELDNEAYRSDETAAFSLMVDTQPVTINFFTRRDVREMTAIRNQDDAMIAQVISSEGEETTTYSSSVHDTYFEIREFGVTVATTNVIDYNMPISWGFTPKWIQMNGSHTAALIEEYDFSTPPDQRVSSDLLEWNFDLGFSILLTDDFLKNALGLDGFWLEGEWVFGMVGMNLFPTDFTPFYPPRSLAADYPGEKRAIQALYQVGVAHYREDFMFAVDVDLTENEVFDFEGLTRFVSIGGEYFWRDDFHLRAGLRLNVAQTDGAGQDKAMLTGGFMYQPRGFSIEASALINEVEMGGTVGFGLAF